MIQRIANLFVGACLWTGALVITAAFSRVAFELMVLGWRWGGIVP